MTVRNGVSETVETWTGLDSWSDPMSLTMQQWSESMNVVVQANGNVVTLRSPANFNPVLSPATGNPVLSCEYYDRDSGGLVFYDITASGSVGTYSTDGSTNTLRRTQQAVSRWQSLNVNNTLYRVNGTEFVQYVAGTTQAYQVGIGPPAAPTVSYVAGGTSSVLVGLTVSYAYRMAATGDVGECSAASNNPGATAGNNTLRIPVVAASTFGIDQIVLFITEDGGSVRYLYVDTNGDPVYYPNSTTNIDINTGNIYPSSGIPNLNYNVEETAFNSPPPVGITNISSWKNRIVGVLGRYVVYSGFDQIAFGTPWAAWPGLNVITIPNKSETAQGGIETPLGWLCLSERNAYLLTGQPTDTIDSGENTLQVTEQFTMLGWNIGTRSPLTIQNSPFGTIFLDQDKHLRFWPWQGVPVELATGLRADLSTIQDTDAARKMAEARWYQTGDQSGFYVLTASTSGSTNNRMWIVTMMQTGGQLFVAGAVSDIAAQSICVSRISGTVRCLIGVTDRLRQILDFNLAGAGWSASQQLYFDMVLGNQQTIFNRLHSLQYDPTDGTIIVKTLNIDGSESRTLNPIKQLGTYFALINTYQVRKKLRFVFPTTDDKAREVKHVEVIFGRKGRVI